MTAMALQTVAPQLLCAVPCDDMLPVSELLNPRIERPLTSLAGACRALVGGVGPSLKEVGKGGVAKDRGLHWAAVPPVPTSSLGIMG